MDEKQIQELIDASVGKALGDLEGLLQPVADKLTESLREYIDSTVSPLEERLATYEAAPKATPEAPSGEAESSPLEARLAELESQLRSAQEAQQAKEQETRMLRFNSTLSQALDKHSPNCKPVVEELLKTRYSGEFKETKKGFLIGGKTLDEVVDGFFTTDEGKYFLPSEYTDGAGIRQPQKQPISDSVDLDAALLQHFSG